MQYRALRSARIGGHDYQPGELIRDSEGLSNARVLISARYIEPAGGASPIDAPAVALFPESAEDDAKGEHDATVTGFLDAEDIGKWTREQLNAVAADMGIEDPNDKSKYPNKDALVAFLVTIPVAVPAEDDGADGDGSGEALPEVPDESYLPDAATIDPDDDAESDTAEEEA